MTDEAKYEAMIEKMARAMAQGDGWEPWENMYPDQQETYLAHARAAAEAIGLKPGCVVVPEQPTEAMRDAAYEAIRDATDSHCGCMSINRAVETQVWQDMIAAAPTPQAD